MTAAVWSPSLNNTGRKLAQAWHDFFHAPCDARICALVRIVFAGLVLINLAVLYPDLNLWFTDAGLLSTENSRDVVSVHAWSVFWWLPGTPAVIHACFWIIAAHAVMLLIGLVPKLNAAALFVWLVSLQMRNGIITDSEDTVMRLICFFLIWMPIGQCWSVNAAVWAWWKNRNSQHPHPGPLPEGEGISASAYQAPGWGLRLLQIQMALIFLSAGLVKLQGETWISGTALYYVARLDEFFGRFPVPQWLFNTPWTVALLTWAVVLVEIVAPLLIWFRETRRACLATLLAFHLASDWSMHLFLFHWLMLCGWLSFLTPGDLRLCQSTDSRPLTPAS